MHVIINDKGELAAFKLTAANVDDRVPVTDLTKNLMGKLVGDKGYISKELFDELFQRGLQLVIGIRKNMVNKLTLLADKLLLMKRTLIETVNGQRSTVNGQRSTINLRMFLKSNIRGTEAFGIL